MKRLKEQTPRKAEETLKFKMTKSRETFHFNPPIPIKGHWMIGLTDRKVHNSIFIINTRNYEFELYTYKFDEFSFEDLKEEREEILSISDFTPYHLQYGKIGPRII